MKTDGSRVEHLIGYVQGIKNKDDPKELYLKYKDDIENVTPQEAFEVLYSLRKSGVEPKEILDFLDKVINVFYKSLAGYSWRKPDENSFIGVLIKENRALAGRLDDIKETLKEKDLEARKSYLIPQIQDLLKFNHHYLKKENILFPYLEKKMEKYNGLEIMWALHDEVRKLLKSIIAGLEKGEYTEAELNKDLGSLFFAMHGLIKKEELILFPAASEVIDERELDEMKRQSLDYEFPFIKKPIQAHEEKDGMGRLDGFTVKTDTGTLDIEQVLMIFNTLPVDMTLVDENNRVRFFNKAKDRLFPRSPAVIGRDVAKCHPPESVHVVHEIIDAFKSGRQDNATFWINIRGKKILIQYFALRDPEGNYRGVLEVSQDITGIIEIKGERRLLHWERD